MCADHDDFIFEIGAGDFSDDVKAVDIPVVVGGFDIDLELWFNSLLDHSNETIVVFCSDDHLR